MNNISENRGTERALVTIRRIDKLEPIEGSDFIVLASVDGWKVIVGKDDFRVGDLGVYFEIDSFLPIEDRYAILKRNSYREMGDKKGFRLRTMKLRGALSQGFLMPLSNFPEFYGIDTEEGLDVTDLLGVVLWDPPVPECLRGKLKGNFPHFIRKTDQIRIQNKKKYWEKYKDLYFEETIKEDGTSCTYYLKDNETGVCSRNNDLKLEDDSSVYVKMFKDLDMDNLLKNSPYLGSTIVSNNYAIQGEIVGEGIQKNRRKYDGKYFKVFDIFDIDKQRYLLPEERRFLTISLGLNHVSVLKNAVKVFEKFPTMESLIDYASSLPPDIEGVVFKSCDYVNDEVISFKVINNNYLLKEKD